MKKAGAAIALALLIPASASALTLDFPALASPIADRSLPYASYFVPVAPFANGAIDGITAEGTVEQQSWRVGSGSLTTMQILAPLRDQLQAAGYTPLFQCEGNECGGYDFRYRLDVLPEPDMHVNLGDYRYFSGMRAGETEDYAVLIVSRSQNAGFVQLTRIGEPSTNRAISTAIRVPDTGAPTAPAGPMAEQLETLGHATLDDLFFPTGSSELGGDAFDSLARLAAYLLANPERAVVLVGHTDAEGALDGNIALSRRRAASVVNRLVQKYDIPARQVSAEGVGYLAPRASNLTDQGRTLNRRVEVILTSTQ